MGEHSGWPYPTGDPLPSENEMKSQAGLMFADLCNGKTVTAIAREHGVARHTVYARLKLISSQALPDRASLRAINFIRSEQLVESLVSDFKSDELDLADKVKLSAEVRQLLDRQAAWFRVAEPDPSERQHIPLGADEDDRWEDEL